MAEAAISTPALPPVDNSPEGGQVDAAVGVLRYLEANDDGAAAAPERTSLIKKGASAGQTSTTRTITILAEARHNNGDDKRSKGEEDRYAFAAPQDLNTESRTPCQGGFLQSAKEYEMCNSSLQRAKACNLPNALVTHASNLFAELATDGKEALEVDGVEALLTSMGYTVPRDLIEEKMLDCDADFTSGLTKSDVLRLIEDIETNTQQKRRVLEAFAMLDMDNTGHIDLAFLRTLLCSSFGSEEALCNSAEAPLSEAEFTHFVVEARATPDGRLDYKNFVINFLFKNPLEPATSINRPRGGKRKFKAKKA